MGYLLELHFLMRTVNLTGDPGEKDNVETARNDIFSKPQNPTVGFNT